MEVDLAIIYHYFILKYFYLCWLPCVLLRLKNIIWRLKHFQLFPTIKYLPLELYHKLRKMYLSPRRESNPQPSDLQCGAPMIELPDGQVNDTGICAIHIHTAKSASRYVYIFLINRYCIISLYLSISYHCCGIIITIFNLFLLFYYLSPWKNVQSNFTGMFFNNLIIWIYFHIQYPKKYQWFLLKMFEK